METNRSIIRVIVKGEDKPYNFTSMKVMFGNLPKEKIGIENQTLRNHFSSKKTNIYENSLCIITKEELIYEI